MREALLLMNYGSQLEYIDFDNVRSDVESWAAVLESRPNVLGVSTTPKDCTLDTIDAVAPRLEEWHMGMMQYSNHLETMAKRRAATATHRSLFEVGHGSVNAILRIT